MQRTSLSQAEKIVIENFVWTLDGLNAQEALAAAAYEVRCSGLSVLAARELGHRVRMKYAKAV